MPKKHWNKLKNDYAIEAERRYRQYNKKQRYIEEDIEDIEEVNQCDGCKMGFPIENGIHVDPSRSDYNHFHMVCTKKQYDRKIL